MPNMTPNTSRSNLGDVGSPRVLRWPCTFHVVCVFQSRWVAKVNVVFSGIWTLGNYAGRLHSFFVRLLILHNVSPSNPIVICAGWDF